VRDERAAAQAREWLAENEDATAMTPERLAALEAAAADADGDADADGAVDGAPRPAVDEDASPVAGRRFSRA
jgi:(E)-4-hydroxy-3-methylbut-2-enyl-diphosphate synthase